MATLSNDTEMKSLFGTLDESLSQIQERQSDIPDIIKNIFREEAGSIQNRWLIGAGSLIIGLDGLFLTVTASPVLQNLLREYGVLVGVICMIASSLSDLDARIVFAGHDSCSFIVENALANEYTTYV